MCLFYQGCSPQVGPGGVQYLTGRVVSGRKVFKSHGSGRVGLGGVRMSPIGSGRVIFANLTISRVGSGHDP